MWQNSKVAPLIEWVSPGVASQTPVSTFSPFEASCAQVLNDGLPEMSRSGAGKELFGANSGLVSMVTRSDMVFPISSQGFDRQGRSDLARRDGVGCYL